MPTSLKEYKGVGQFVELARQNMDFNFVLLCSVPLAEMEAYFEDEVLPKNLTLVGKQSNLLNFYREAAVTTNLSLQDKFVETFGLTIAEGFDTLTPAIAPAYGGPKEIVSDGQNGFLVNPYDTEQISSALRNLLSDFETYKRFSLNAEKSLEKFSVETFREGIISEIGKVLK